MRKHRALGTAAFLLLAVAPAATHPGARVEGSDTGATAFSIGEKLQYHVEWNPPWYLFFLPSMEAGEAQLHLAGETTYQGKKAVRIVFEARSSGTLVKLSGVRIDDYFEFITDPETFCTFAARKKIREGKRKRDIEVFYHPGQGQLHIRELDLAADPPVTRKDEIVKGIPDCVQDLFSALYAARRQPLSLGFAHRSLVGDNDRVKEIEARVEKREFVQTPNGTYETWQVTTVALLGGLFKDGGQFRIWLTKDERKLPVKFEAKVNLGKVTGRLKSVEP